MPRYDLRPSNFHFTERLIRELPPHDRDSRSAQREYCDAGCIGLRIMVNKHGRKFWMFRYRWRGRKYACWIGEVSPVMSLKAARQRIWQMRAMMSHGENPADWKMRQRGTPTFRRFVEEQYLPYCKATVTRPDVVISRLNSGALPLFGERPLDCISRADVQQFHAAMRLKLCPATAGRSA